MKGFLVMFVCAVAVAAFGVFLLGTWFEVWFSSALESTTP